jgi:pimeloyl-ACP methyl ester carboxylesterase
LFNRNSPVLIYAGEFDAQDGPATQNPWVRKLNVPNYDEFWGQSRKIYYVWNETLSEYITGGYYRSSSTFSYLTVPKAGHFVPNWTNNYLPTY